MYGIVSLLDATHEARVRALWAEFREKFDVEGVARVPIPHLSYHIADEYDLPRMKPLLNQIAHDTEVFEVDTDGLGIFTGENPVLYIPVRFNDALVRLQKRLWTALDAVSTAPNAHYEPADWVPHITLAHNDVDHDLLPNVIRLISERNFYWRIKIDNLTVLGSKEGQMDKVQLRLPFMI